MPLTKDEVTHWAYSGIDFIARMGVLGNNDLNNVIETLTNLKRMHGQTDATAIGYLVDICNFFKQENDRDDSTTLDASRSNEDARLRQ